MSRVGSFIEKVNPAIVKNNNLILKKPDFITKCKSDSVSKGKRLLGWVFSFIAMIPSIALRKNAEIFLVMLNLRHIVFFAVPIHLLALFVPRVFDLLRTRCVLYLLGSIAVPIMMRI